MPAVRTVGDEVVTGEPKLIFNIPSDKSGGLRYAVLPYGAIRNFTTPEALYTAFRTGNILPHEWLPCKHWNSDREELVQAAHISQIWLTS